MAFETKQEDEKLDYVHEEENGVAQTAETVPVSAFAELSIIQTFKTFKKSVLMCTLVSIGALFDGYAISIPGSIIANPGFVAQFGSEFGGALALNAQHVAAWGGIQSGGQIVSMLGGPFISDRWGRKVNMYILTGLIVLSIILEIVAKEWIVYLVAKLLAGMAVGLIQSGLTVWIAEVAPTQIRGALLAGYSLWFAIGQMAASIGLQVLNTTNPLDYKRGFYSQFALLALWLPGLLLAPESPWFYAKKHRHEDAKKVLMKLCKNVPGYDVEREYSVLQLDIQASEALAADAKRSRWVELFRGVNGRRTFISFFPLAFQQFLGIPLIFGYSTFFFSLAGLADPFLGTMIISLILVLFLLISFFIVDKAGRRPLLLGGGVVMFVCTLVIGCLGLKTELNGTALVSMCALWVAAYALSAGPLGWSYCAETATPRLRAMTTGVSAAGTAGFGLIFNYTVPLMLSPQVANWGLKIGFLFAGLTAAGLVVIFFTIPETKGRSFAELDELFEARVGTLKFGKAKTEEGRMREGVVA